MNIGTLAASEMFLQVAESDEGNMEHEENVIQWSDDLGIFTPNPHNRGVEEKRVLKLMASIKKKNNLHLFPIIVRPNLMLIDGHHRLEVANRMGLRLYYVISEQMTIADAKDATDATSTWTMQDYLHHWCSYGLPDYLKLKDFWLSHSWMTLSMASDLCNSGDLGGMTFREFFTTGKYKANDVEFAMRLGYVLLDFKTYVPRFYRDIRFVTALKHMLKSGHYDHKHMMSKMEHQHSRLTKQATTLDFINVLNGIYNWRTPDNKKHTFEAPRYLKK